MPDGIVFVSPWLRDGGVETSIQVMLPWLARHGHRVALLSWEIEERLAGRTNPVLVTLRDSGIPVHRLRGHVRLHLIQYAAQTALFLKRGGYRVVVGHELYGNIVAVLANFLLRSRLRVICSVHSASDIYSAVGTKPLLVRLGRALYRRADGVVAPTEGVRQDAISFFGLDPSRAVTVYLPFTLDRIRRLATEPNDLDPGGLQPEVLGCARLAKMKGFPDLLQAFRLVRAETAAALVILGDGPERDQLSSLAKRLGIGSDVRMPGFVANPFPYFRRASTFVLSSRFGEAFGRVLVEAMACGTPVVSTRCPWGPAEVLGYGKYGLLCDVGDVEGLASCILRILKGADEAARLSRLGRDRAEEFDEDRVMPKLEQLYLGRTPPTVSTCGAIL